jgi:hypothetical protein
MNTVRETALTREISLGLLKWEGSTATKTLITTPQKKGTRTKKN